MIQLLQFSPTHLLDGAKISRLGGMPSFTEPGFKTPTVTRRLVSHHLWTHFMLDRLLPRNTPLRRQMASLARRVNFAVPARIQRNFTDVPADQLASLRRVVAETYFRDWVGSDKLEEFLNSDDGRQSMDNQLLGRLNQVRSTFIPWIDSVLPLKDLNILEIGAGTGVAAIAMAEQGAHVVGVDVCPLSLAVGRLRAQAHTLSERITLIEGDAKDLPELLDGRPIDLIVFFAVLEHMTYEQRLASLKSAWSILRPNQYLCITHTPNRLWFYDGHTSRLPFFNWLPDEIAYEYSRYSPRMPFNEKFAQDREPMNHFIGEGRGFSFHEMDLALDGAPGFSIVSDMSDFLFWRHPATLIKRLVSGDRKCERILRSFAPQRHRGFFRANINLLLKKD